MDHKNSFCGMKRNEKMYIQEHTYTLQCYWAFGLPPEADEDIRMLTRGDLYQTLPIDLSRDQIGISISALRFQHQEHFFKSNA